MSEWLDGILAALTAILGYMLAAVGFRRRENIRLQTLEEEALKQPARVSAVINQEARDAVRAETQLAIRGEMRLLRTEVLDSVGALDMTVRRQHALIAANRAEVNALLATMREAQDAMRLAVQRMVAATEHLTEVWK